jgi:vacuolar iron transporter family protein
LTPEVADRLLQAWRAEVTAAALYELIARRMPAGEAEILRRIAATESGHRERLEQHMRAHGIEPPSPETVRLSAWRRLQARIAPVSRLLAVAEAGEDDAVGDLYLRPTGDAATDALLGDLRAEERQHSGAIRQLRGGSTEGAVRELSPPSAAAQSGKAGPEERLQRILGRERWHRTGGGWIGGAIYGANDGLAAVFGIVAGVSGATGGSSFVLTAGISGAIASALSMATGAFLAEHS